MSFITLIIAGLFEVAGVSTLNVFSTARTTQRKTAFLLATIVLFAASLSSLSLAMQDILLSIAYAVWTGIGAAGAVAVGVWISKDKITLQKAAGLVLTITSAIALKVM
ncbi:LuxR family transcriptional regulator [Actinobacillus succinogenes]|uniref:Small multidrug resistance protein n=2 Tax=Actinobacillus succinogenes TaxID=67854 RepID=A6VPU0_ACTSZ|nr:SMR family transporter [Actinobacillus succinogenes]ABR74987.1 small multidrug resistance protein [Actinobacillus succinogenes 130Z]PHI40606.1 LuxR family transcriptional regulator [Actinobacillus succinogenes]